MRNQFPPGFSFKISTLSIVCLSLGLLDPTKLLFLAGLLFMMLSYELPRQQFKFIFKRSNQNTRRK